MENIKYFEKCIDNLKKSLECPICKQLFNAPIVGNCGHSFCSRCIRDFCNNPADSKCPICLKRLIISSMHREGSLAEAVKKFSIMEKFIQDENLFSNFHDTNSTSNTNINNNNTSDINNNSNTSINNNNNNKNNKNTKSTKRNQSSLTFNQNTTCYSECPVCGELYTLREIEESHLNKCLSENGNPNKKIKSNDIIEAKYLPNLDLKSYKTDALIRKAVEYGLSSYKNEQRAFLEEILQHWIIIYNSNEDNTISRLNKQQLLSSLREWVVNKKNSQKAIKNEEIDTKKYLEIHKNEYNDLITLAKSTYKKQIIQKATSRFLSDG